MEFYYKKVDEDALILSADGGLDKGTAGQFVGELEKIIEAGAAKIIVDCTKLNYVSLHGLRTLFGLHKKLAGQGGDVKVSAVRGTIAVREPPSESRPLGTETAGKPAETRSRLGGTARHLRSRRFDEYNYRVRDIPSTQSLELPVSLQSLQLKTRHA